MSRADDIRYEISVMEDSIEVIHEYGESFPGELEELHWDLDELYQQRSHLTS